MDPVTTPTLARTDFDAIIKDAGIEGGKQAVQGVTAFLEQYKPVSTPIADPKPEGTSGSALLDQLIEQGSRRDAEPNVISMAQGKTGAWSAEMETVDSFLERHEEAEMEQGAVGGLVKQLDGIGGLGVPFGSVLVGAIPGVVAGEVIDGFFPRRTAAGMVNWVNPAIKVGVAWAGVQYGKGLLGSGGTMFFAGALALQAFSLVLPLDEWVARLVAMFRRVTPGNNAVGAVAQAEQIVRQSYMGQSFNPRPAQGGMWA